MRWSRLNCTIENRVQYMRDTALREDACRGRKGSLPRVMAAFAYWAISVLRLLGKKNVKRAMGSFKLCPNTAGAARPGRQHLGRSRTAGGAANGQ